MGVWSQKQDIAFYFFQDLVEREKNPCFISPGDVAGSPSSLRAQEAQARAALGPGVSSAASLSGAVPLKRHHYWENYLFLELTFAIWLYWFRPLARPVRIPQLRSSQWLNLHVGEEDPHLPSWFCRFGSWGLAVPTPARRVSSGMQHEKWSTSALSLQIQRRASLRNSSLLAWSMEGIWS